MNASSHTAQSSTQPRVPEGLHEILAPVVDVTEIGWECANPVLQIELWGHEVFTPPLQRLS